MKEENSQRYLKSISKRRYHLMTDVCFICGGNDTVKYCSLCKHYLCIHCKNNPPKRLIAFLKEKLGK